MSASPLALSCFARSVIASTYGYLSCGHFVWKRQNVESADSSNHKLGGAER